MKKVVKKAVFPVAGLGTRFLPATKASPKEMLPIVDKPLIQYAVEEAIAAGIEVMVFVTGRNKRAIPDHFDKAYELETELEARGNEETLKLLRSMLPSNITCVYIRQSEALGLGHAVHCAKPVVGDEPFAVILADDLVEDGERGCLAQMTELYAEHQCSILGVERVPQSETDKYGIVSTTQLGTGLGKVDAIVEKPKPAEAPSTLGVVGRYILEANIFKKIEQTGRGAGGEIQLTDAIELLLHEEQVLAYEFKGTRYDCGSKLGYLIATVEHGLMHDELREGFKAYLKGLTLD